MITHTRAIASIALAMLGILASSAGIFSGASLEAQVGAGNGSLIEPSVVITGTPVIRTAADMRAAASAPVTAGAMPRFLPTVSAAEYAAQKAAAAAGAPRSGAPAPTLLPTAAAPTLQFINFEGLGAGTVGAVVAPPDPHGAVGHTQYVEVVNAAIRVYTKGVPGTSQPTVVASFTLPAFFGTTDALFNPRVIYDPEWQRWVVIATRHSTSASDAPRLWLAVSNTNDASGSWCLYNDTVGVGGQWWDYPQLGRDRDAIILTTNVFSNADVYQSALILPLPKSRMYNCLDWSATGFHILPPSVAPPIVLDANPGSMLLSTNGSTVQKYTLTNSSRSPSTLTGPVAIAGVPAWTVPPDAPQLGTSTLLDTLDGRFVNASTQTVSLLWNAHTVNNGGIAGVRWYAINHFTNAVFQQGTIPGGSNSLFNASIAANDANTAFMTYTMSSPAFRPQVRFSGKNFGETVIPFGTALVTSPAAFSGVPVARWGGYSAVTIDPSDTTKAWIVNEYAGGTSRLQWRTRIGRIGN